MDKFIGYQVTATHHTSQIASQVSAITTQASVNEATLLALNKTMEKLVQALDKVGVNLEKDTSKESSMGGKTESITRDSSNQALSDHNITQSPALLLTTMDSDALDGYVRSLPLSQRKENAEKWETTRHSKKRAKKRATRQQSESSRDTSSKGTSPEDGKTRVSLNTVNRKTAHHVQSSESDDSMDDFSNSSVELVTIIKKHREESESSDFEMEMENIVNQLNSRSTERGSKQTQLTRTEAMTPRGGRKTTGRPTTIKHPTRLQAKGTKASPRQRRKKSTGKEDINNTNKKK